jgi:two-component system phosphate regulon sensor histidine kinase PhoR
MTLVYFWLVVGALALAALGAWAWSRIVAPLCQLRRALRDLAHGHTQLSLPVAGAAPLQRCAGELRAVAERLAASESHTAEEQRSLRGLLGSMVEGVLIVDATQRIELANDSLARMFDLDHAPVQRRLMDVFRSHELHAAVMQAIDTRRPQRAEIAHGGRRHFALTTIPLHAGAMAIFHDITRLRELERVRQDFVANVSHELRTPLTIINGYIETLRDGAMAEPELAAEALGVMARHGERLRLLAEDLLTLSRLESDEAPLDSAPVNVRAAIEQTLAQLAPEIARRGAAVELDAASDLPPVPADARALDQLFTNLLDNALRHAASDRLRIRIAAEVSGPELCIRVQDNGPGIPPEDQPRIFERFYRVGKDRARASGGTGLGLAIVKHIAQAHGGSVQVGDAPGGGAAFEVRLPLRARCL